MGAARVPMPVRPLVISLLVPLLLVAAPSAGALTLDDFEEPYRGSDVSGGVVAFTVPEEHADVQRGLIYRNDPRTVFNLSVVDERGDVVFSKRGTRGVQTLPALPPGDYRFTIGGEGEFQVTEKSIRTLGTTEAILDGVDAYIVVLPEWANLSVSGNVSTEAWNLASPAPSALAPNATTVAPAGGVVILTLRGEPGTPYAITAEETAAPPTPATAQSTPVPGILPLLLVALGVALARAGPRRAR